MLKIAIVEDERECQEALIEHLRKYEKEKNQPSGFADLSPSESAGFCSSNEKRWMA